MSESEAQNSSETGWKEGELVQHNGGWFLRFMFPTEQQFEAVRNFPLNDNDIMIVSFPKSGTSWIQQIVWLLTHGCDDGDKRRIIERIKYLEYNYKALDEVAKRKSPRFLKSHLPYGCLPAAVEQGRGKVIYIARNAKDVCVSLYHFYRLLRLYSFHGDFSEFYEMFKTGRVSYGPWQDHVGDFWDHRSDKNVLFLFYEDLIQQPKQMVAKIAQFLELSSTDDLINDVVRKSTFSAMKDDPAVNYSWMVTSGAANASEAPFMRNGVIGDWVNYFTADREAEIYQRCIEPLERRGLTFIDRLSDSQGKHSE